MATKIPPHNLREIAAARAVVPGQPGGRRGDHARRAASSIVKGPDFPTGGLIVGTTAIEEAYRTGRGSIRMRAVVEVEEDKRGRACLVVTELPYQVNPDNLAERVRRPGQGGQARRHRRHPRRVVSGRTGMRLVLVLKRDAVAKVVLNNLYKHTQLQETFGANMLALVDGVPRTLNLAQFLRHYVAHQIEVIVRRTAYRLRKAEERAHILRGLVKALDMLDEVIALIRRSPTVEEARTGLMQLLDIDEIQATAILDMQLRRLAALERQKIIDELAKIEIEIAELQDILAKPERQRKIVSDELAEIVGQVGRRPPHPDHPVRRRGLDGGPHRPRGRRRHHHPDRLREADQDRPLPVAEARRQGRLAAPRCARTTSSATSSSAPPTTGSCSSRTRAGSTGPRRTSCRRRAGSRGVSTWRTCWRSSRTSRSPRSSRSRTTRSSPYLVLATKKGLVKKTSLDEFDSNRSGGIIAINLRDDDELVGAALIGPRTTCCWSASRPRRSGSRPTTTALRPMGRATSGVIGMRFTEDDELLAMEVVRDGMDVLVATDGGFAKRTPIDEYPVQGRGGKGVLTAKITQRRGGLVGAVVISPDDELFAITSNGGVIRTPVKPVRRTRDRNTMGVKLMDLPDGVTLVAIARNADEPETRPRRNDARRSDTTYGRTTQRTGLVDDGDTGEVGGCGGLDRRGRHPGRAPTDTDDGGDRPTAATRTAPSRQRP